MGSLHNDKAFNEETLSEIYDIAGSTMAAAHELNKAMSVCMEALEKNLKDVPTEARIEGFESDVRRLGQKTKKILDDDEYLRVKRRIQRATEDLKREVPFYDKKNAAELNRISAVNSRILTRINDITDMLNNGSTDIGSDSFTGTLKYYEMTWEKEEKDTERLMNSIKAGMKGMELKSCQYSEDPVNMSTGNFIYEKTDIKIDSRRPLMFSRFYNALGERAGVLGIGWMHNYEVHIRREKDRIIVCMEDGREEHFEHGESGDLSNIRGNVGKLEVTEDGYCYKKQNGSMYIFDREGRYIKKADEAGEHFRLHYNEAGKLEKVTTGTDRQKTDRQETAWLSYTYHENGMLETVSDHTGRKVVLTYENDCLAEVGTPENTSLCYRYDDMGKITAISNPQGIVTVKNKYDKEGRTIRQTFPDWNVMRYQYLDGERRVELTERNGAKIIYCRDHLFRNVRTIYEDGEETFTYNRNNKKTSHTDKNGNRTLYAYDNRGNLTMVTDPLGNKTAVTYNHLGEVLKISVNGEEKLSNSYDTWGNLIKTTDGTGRSTEILYNANHQPETVIHADGSRLSVAYDEKGNMTGVKDARGISVSYAYDARNRVIKTTDANGNTTRYAYDDKDRMTAVTNAEGNTRGYTYTPTGKVMKMTDFDGSEITYTYNRLNRLETITDQEGNTRSFTYDDMWNINTVTDAEGAKTQYIYNRQNRLQKVINPLGDSVSYTHDPVGNLIEITGTDGTQVRYAYDAMNHLTRIEEPDGITKALTYDAEGNLTALSSSIGHHIEITYDAAGRKLSQTDIEGHRTDYAYNEMGKLKTITDHAGRTTEYHYQKGGLLEKVTYPDKTWESYAYDGCKNIIQKERTDGYSISYEYDCMNRLKKMQSNTGQEKQYRYNATGSLISMTDAGGHTTSCAYDKAGRMTRITNAEGGCTAYRYDKNGNIIEIARYQKENEADKQVTQYVRNALGQVIEVIDSLGQKKTYAYDKTGRLIKKTEKDGQETTYTYTNVGQPANIKYADGKEVNFTYNELRRLTHVTDWLGEMEFTHDKVGHLAGVTDQRGKTVHYRYGEFGQKEAITYPDGREILYEYDDMLRLIRLLDGDHETTYSYDPYGRPKTKKTAQDLITAYEYDKTGQPSLLTQSTPEGLLESRRYQYDPSGNLIQEERIRQGQEAENGIYSYAYDQMDRLTQVIKDGNTIRSYAYDTYGNRIQKQESGTQTTYIYNALNQLTEETEKTGETREIKKSYQYDPRGNLVQTTENGQTLQTYAYDATNRLTKATNSKGREALYQYNGLGYRTGKSIEGKEIRYIIDLTKPYDNLLQKEEDGKVQNYVWDRHLNHMEEAGERYDYMTDILGSPIRLTDENRQMAALYGYDEFGNDLYENQGRHQPFGYTGYLRDDITGGHFAQRREYDPRTGRFQSEDPSQYGTNWYLYCQANPMLSVDPTGLMDVPKWLEETKEDINQGIKDMKNSIDKVMDKVKIEINELKENPEAYMKDVGKKIDAQLKVIVPKVTGGKAMDEFTKATQSGAADDFLETFDFVKDEDEIYYVRKFCWQWVFGYNNFYDYAFDLGTDMDVKPFPVTTLSGKTYVLWTWKGDYLNLGAGAEAGLYIGDGPHHRSALPVFEDLPMTLALYHEDGSQIFDRRPEVDQWWITGFEPDIQDQGAADLTSIATFDLSGEPELWEAFYKEYGEQQERGLCFDVDSRKIHYKW